MIGLMTRRKLSAARSIDSADHENQRASSVMMSRRILLSTNTAVISVVPGQGHDGIRAHCDVTASPQMGHKAGATAAAFPGLGSDDPHDLAIELELHLSVGQQARPFADFGRD